MKLALADLKLAEEREGAQDRPMTLAYECPHCGRKSYSADDYIYRYCSFCHSFDDNHVYDPKPEPPVA